MHDDGRHGPGRVQLNWLFAAMGSVLLISLLFLDLAHAQDRRTANFVNAGRINIQTNGLLADGVTVGSVSPSMRLITQLIREIDEPGKIRVLPIVGYGQEENIRDLLHLRGVEFSVVNSDILAHLAQEGRLPKAKEKLRMVMPLIQKAVIVVANTDVGSIEALSGKSVATGGAGSQERITARTLFNVLGVRPTFTTGTGESVLTAVQRGDSKAGVLLTHEPEELIQRIGKNPALKILDVPWSEKVAAVYDKASISVVGAPEVQTVTLDTVLAIYNWQTSNSRFRNVSNFLRRAVSAVPDLIAGPPSLWNRIDIDKKVPGWERYAFFDSELDKTRPERTQRIAVLKKRLEREKARKRAAQVAAASSVDEGTGTDASLAANKVEAKGITQSGLTQVASRSAIPAADALNLIALDTGYLSSKTGKDGGLVTALLLDALAKGGTETDGLSVSWSVDAVNQVTLMLSDEKYNVGIPWLKPDCDATGSLTLSSAIVCDQFQFSDAIFTVPFVLIESKRFAEKSGSNNTIDAAKIARSRICSLEQTDTSSLAGAMRKKGVSATLNIVRQSNYAACFAALSDGRVDYVFGTSSAAKTAMTNLGIENRLVELPFPIGTATLHAIVAKGNPQATVVMARLNAAIESLRKSEAYQTRINSYLNVSQ